MGTGGVGVSERQSDYIEDLREKLEEALARAETAERQRDELLDVLEHHLDGEVGFIRVLRVMREIRPEIGGGE